MSSTRKKLFELIKNVDLSKIKLILPNYNGLSIVNEDEEFTLYTAAKKGDLEIFKYLIKLGANCKQRITSFKHWTGGTAITIAAMKRHWEIVSFLIEHGALVGAHNYEWETPLHYSAMYGNIQVVKLLIENRAEINSNLRI